MKATDTASPEAVAITAACRLHQELLPDENFAGYDGTKSQFDELFRELFVIAYHEVSLEVEPILQVIDTWYQYQAEISEGSRDAFWYHTY